MKNTFQKRLEHLSLVKKADFMAFYKNYGAHSDVQVSESTINGYKKIASETLARDVSVRFEDIPAILQYWIVDSLEAHSWFKTYVENIFDALLELNNRGAIPENKMNEIMQYFSKSRLAGEIKNLFEQKGDLVIQLDYDALISFCRHENFESFIKLVAYICSRLNQKEGIEHEISHAITDSIRALQNERKIGDNLTMIVDAMTCVSKDFPETRELIENARLDHRVSELSNMKQKIIDLSTRGDEIQSKLDSDRRSPLLIESERISAEWNAVRNLIASSLNKLIRPATVLQKTIPVLDHFIKNTKDVNIEEVESVISIIQLNLVKIEKNAQKIEKIQSFLSSNKKINEIKSLINKRDELQLKRQEFLDKILEIDLPSRIKAKEQDFIKNQHQKAEFIDNFNHQKKSLLADIDRIKIAVLKLERIVNAFYYKCLIVDVLDGREIEDIILSVIQMSVESI